MYVCIKIITTKIIYRCEYKCVCVCDEQTIKSLSTINSKEQKTSLDTVVLEQNQPTVREYFRTIIIIISLTDIHHLKPLID